MSEVTFEPFQRVLVRDSNESKWEINLFERKQDGNFLCLYGCWFYCIPYNDDTKHLLGTTDSPTPPEPEFKWGDHVEVRDEEIQTWLPAIYTGKNDRGVYAILKGEPLVNHWKYCRHADW